jgi:nitrile hydratase subunit alpha
MKDKRHSHHDMGGEPAGKVEQTEHDYAEWERRIDAMNVLLWGQKGGQKLMTVDQHRKNIEALAPGDYDGLSYYEKWIASTSATMVERGVVSQEELGEYRPLPAMADRLRDVLVGKGYLTQEAIDAEMEEMRRRTPARGAAVVARAWVDASFRSKLLEDGRAACESIGIEIPLLRLIAVENTPAVHNAIVCTLCSCYPRMLLGIPPDWYKSRAYRSRMVKEPRKVLEEFGLKIESETVIRVHDSTADMRYMVLPMRPAGTEGWNEERLAAIVSRNSMIGVDVPRLS